MIKEALEYIVGLGTGERFNIGTQQYSTHSVQLIKEATTDKFIVRNLIGLIDYLKSEFDGKQKLLVHVESPTSVEVFTEFNRDKRRNYLIKAEALLPSFPFERFLDVEEMNIKLQSGFVQNEDRDTLLKVIGNIREEDVKVIGDDGVSQGVTVKSGVATVEETKVPNPVSLKPFRTFVEIEQPESNFVFRMRKGPSASLIEADAGAWKLDAMYKIKAYLEENLQEQIENGSIVVIA